MRWNTAAMAGEEKRPKFLVLILRISQTLASNQHSILIPQSLQSTLIKRYSTYSNLSSNQIYPFVRAFSHFSTN